MPYRVPDTFFADVEERIMADVTLHKKKHNLLKFVIRSTGIAAMLALFIAVAATMMLSSNTDFYDIAQAFDDLSETDQSYIIESYQDDIFINQ